MNPLNRYYGVPTKPEEPRGENREFDAVLTLFACMIALLLIYWSTQALFSWEQYIADYIPKIEDMYAAY